MPEYSLQSRSLLILFRNVSGEMPADIHDMLMNEQFGQFLAVMESTAGNWIETNSSSLMKRKNYIYFSSGWRGSGVEDGAEFPWISVNS